MQTAIELATTRGLNEPSLLRHIHYSDFVHSAACQVKPPIRRGDHIAHHTTAGRDRFGAEAL
jgi:hypothetical protein